MNQEQTIRDEIDNYTDSLFAIIGFMNFYRYDDKSGKMRDDVLVFQGRRLTPSKKKAKNERGEVVDYVTPDLGILLPSRKGVLGEVKKSFPRDQTHWIDDFRQLMAYDDDLTGWPLKSQRTVSHDIVLLLHQSRAIAVKEFVDLRSEKDIKFERPFSIIEFNRSSQGREYVFFRTVSGSLSLETLAERLRHGVSVPLTVYLRQYSTVKLYDCPPPLPYLLELIWTHVVAFKVSNSPGYRIPARKQKIKVDVSIDEISERLETLFSFHVLQKRHADTRQPKVLKESWVREACEKLVMFGDAIWTDVQEGRLQVEFVKRDDVLDHFVRQCAKEPRKDDQMDLFQQSQ